MKWIESPASDRCCSYEGTLYPPGQEVARLTTSNNCSKVTSMTTITTTSLYINPQVILFCSSGLKIQVEVEDLCQTSVRPLSTTPGTNTNTCPLALERIEAMIEEAQTNIEAKVEEVQSNIGSRIEEVGNNIEAQIQEVCTTCATPAPVTEGLIVKV